VSISTRPSPPNLEERQKLISHLSRLRSSAERKKFLSRHKNLLHVDVVLALADSVPKQAKADTKKAARLADMAVLIAQSLRNKFALARSIRAKANALYSLGQNRAAVEHHEKARKIFAMLRDKTELARTLSASIQPLILLGKYKSAIDAAEQARKIFLAEGNHWRLARVELNAGNIFHRQDRFTEALAGYEKAYEYFREHQEKDPEAVAVALHNMAVCLVSLNDFHRAVATYQEARSFAERHGLPLLASQADYNIAWLHYLRGDYGRAIELLRSTRETCQKSGDQYHVAVCQMDLSEIYLELNLSEEAAEMAEKALSSFQQLGINYEAAKSLANLAIAESRQRKPTSALERFASARKIFVGEENYVWPAVIDLYRSVTLQELGRHSEARSSCISARNFFAKSNLVDKLALSYLVLSRLQLHTGNLGAAAAHCRAALTHLAKSEFPALKFQAYCLMAQIHITASRPAEAYQCYQQARESMETLRSALHKDELKISFMRNKQELYEGLVELCLQLKPEQFGKWEAFQYIEQAKSRALRDLLLSAGSPVHSASNSDGKIQRRLHDLRAEISWFSKRYEIEQLRSNKKPFKALGAIRAQMLNREQELLRLLRELPPSSVDGTGLAPATPASIEEIRASLGSDSTLIEYFLIRDHFVAVVLESKTLEIVPLGTTSRVADLLTRLQFQLSNYRVRTQDTHGFGSSLLKTTQQHLKDLYVELVGPLRNKISGRHLVIVPHGILHTLPFQALLEGREYLVDLFSISYAPSAAVYGVCNARSTKSQGPALILGIPDPASPLVLQEAKAIASTVTHSELLLGEKATIEVLRKRGAHSRLIHIATHGHFRRDNPMFSGIRLGDSLLTLYDLYQLRLPAELITLSGCATGLNVVAAGDEPVGLARGLIYAGAQSALLTLWDVHDESTCKFMASFYKCLSSCTNKAQALQQASFKLRASYPHPYYWAPFILLGKVTSA